MSENVVSKHATVMTMPEQGLVGVRKFSNLTEEEMMAGEGPPEIHYLSEETWEAMGSPETITVYVLPGDHLNTNPTEEENSDG